MPSKMFGGDLQHCGYICFNVVVTGQFLTGFIQIFSNQIQGLLGPSKKLTFSIVKLQSRNKVTSNESSFFDGVEQAKHD